MNMAQGYHGFMKHNHFCKWWTKIVANKSHKWTSQHASSGAMDNGMHGVAFSAACLVSPDINTPSSHICSHKYVLAAVLEAWQCRLSLFLVSPTVESGSAKLQTHKGGGRGRGEHLSVIHSLFTIKVVYPLTRHARIPLVACDHIVQYVNHTNWCWWI